MLKNIRHRIIAACMIGMLGVLGFVFKTDLQSLAPKFTNEIEMKIEAQGHVTLDDAH